MLGSPTKDKTILTYSQYFSIKKEGGISSHTLKWGGSIPKNSDECAYRVERTDKRAADPKVRDEVLNKDRYHVGLAGTGHNHPQRADQHDDPAVENWRFANKAAAQYFHLLWRNSPTG